ncbi:MAG: BsuPI-related putative proteinase inhibitor [Gemmatimonadetes bacterium]|nr:BsuPI-related putative proteinase inhibitor [Gemmatimonadota bacterium]
MLARPVCRISFGAAVALACANPTPSVGRAEPTDAGGAAAPPARDTGAVLGADLRLDVVVPRGPSRPGEPLTFELTVTNQGSADLAIHFSNGQRYDFEVVAEDGTRAWLWSDGRFFTMALGREVLSPGETLRWSETLDEGLAVGVYRVVATLASIERPSVETRLVVEG